MEILMPGIPDGAVVDCTATGWTVVDLREWNDRYVKFSSFGGTNPGTFWMCFSAQDNIAGSIVTDNPVTVANGAHVAEIVEMGSQGEQRVIKYNERYVYLRAGAGNVRVRMKPTSDPTGKYGV